MLPAATPRGTTCYASLGRRTVGTSQHLPYISTACTWASAATAVALLCPAARSKTKACLQSARTARLHGRVSNACARVRRHDGPEGVQLETAEIEADDRVARSLELLSDYSTEKHPGHRPGRFAGPGPEYDGMVLDLATGLWHLEAAEAATGDTKTMVLAGLSEADRSLVTKFELRGGLALALSNAFRVPDRLRREAMRVLRSSDGSGADDAAEDAPSEEESAVLAAEVAKILGPAGVEFASQVFGENSPTGRGLVMLHAANVSEEREALMRNVWSDIQFRGGDVSNAELVSHLERQFANQLVATTETRLGTRAEETEGAGASNSSNEGDVVDGAADAEEADDAIFNIALRGCTNVADLAQRLPKEELDATLLEPRNLGVALDLVGVYLKNYEIDKAELVITRVVPLCRQRGGTWLIKGLDKLSMVRMKQFRAYDAMAALTEIEEVVPFSEPDWQFHDILYRNLAWCYSVLGEPERCLEYTRKSVEVKRDAGIPSSWFDIWDMGKSHASLGQKMGQRKEMQVGYELCMKAAEIHRSAEPGDFVMLAKVLSNAGEVALGIGDTYEAEGNDEDAQLWFVRAEPSLRESYELHTGALGPLKPLSGWAAGTTAHCMARLGKWEECAEFLALAWKVECTKDSTTTGAVIELLSRVQEAQQMLGDPQGLARYLDDLDLGLQGLRARGWDRRERDVFALLLQRAANVVLLSDDGSGKAIPRAFDLLREAVNHLEIFLGSRREQELQREPEGEGVRDVPHKEFGPRADPEALLQDVRNSVQYLGMVVQSVEAMEMCRQSKGGEPELE
mmetsp:Transcript_106580/g.344030  ORF Transcript_106580/g.344030 Transcript_106580/m.344030 type:complete len:799 (-) Transcript_106580:813-3209(-)